MRPVRAPRRDRATAGGLFGACDAPHGWRDGVVRHAAFHPVEGRPVMMSRTGRSLWFTAPREVELREEILRAPGEGEVLLRGLASLISAGTEMNVYRGEIGSADELVLPTSRGTFPFPMNYGYQIVARVAEVGAGVDLEVGDRVFAVHPHQDAFVMPVEVPVASG